jgi:hypothetical protein
MTGLPDQILLMLRFRDRVEFRPGDRRSGINSRSRRTVNAVNDSNVPGLPDEGSLSLDEGAKSGV